MNPPLLQRLVKIFPKSAINTNFPDDILNQIFFLRPVDPEEIFGQESEIRFPDRVPFRAFPPHVDWTVVPIVSSEVLKRNDPANEPGKTGMGQIFAVFKIGPGPAGNGFSPDEFRKPMRGIQ